MRLLVNFLLFSITSRVLIAHFFVPKYEKDENEKKFENGFYEE